MKLGRMLLPALLGLAMSIGLVPGSVLPAEAAASIPTTADGAPSTLPALGSWQSEPGRGFTFRRGLGVISTDPALAGTATTLAEELSAVLDTPITVQQQRDQRPGDVVLRRDESADSLGQEGYRADVDSMITITGATDNAVFLGTRSVLQWAELGRNGAKVPAGQAVDRPQYAERGVGICACQIQVSVPSIERAMADAAYKKYNQIWLETKITSTAYPKANFWAYFTREEAAQISDLAKKYHLTLVTEVNSPGHMKPWLYKYPELQLVDKNGNRQPDRLDITKPEAYEMVTTLIDEYLAAIDSPYWHMGADEYMLGSGYADYPQIAAYAKQQWGPQAQPIDVFIDFLNRVNDHVKSKGKTLRIWNDGLPRQWATQRLDTDVVIEHWFNTDSARVSDLLKQGYRLQNASQSLYGVRGAYFPNPAALWNSKWTPLVFAGSSTPVTAAPGQVTGGKLTLWPDNGAGHTENQMWTAMAPTLDVLAQANWGSKRPVSTYQEFTALGALVGDSPVHPDTGSAELAEGGYVIGSVGAILTATNPVRMGSDPTAWTLTRTPDGYHTIRAGTSCLDIIGAQSEKWLGVPLDSGVPTEIAACDEKRNLQKWVLEKAPGGYRLINAITRLPLHVAADGTLQQAPPDQVTPTVFTVGKA
ncbi:MAG: family 20 glycosylhydrolase [Propionibacteriales bacterium]|nr:family 20 glycosylhydrolase [Propionibacteriales bacterium]